MTSSSVAPILFICTNPLIPNVEGNIHENTFQNAGMEAPGHEIPLINKRGIDVNTNISIQVSRLRIKMEVVIAKNMHAVRYGSIKPKRVFISAICTMLNMRGTMHEIYAAITA